MQQITLDAQSLKFLATWCFVTVAMGALGGVIGGTLGKVLTALAVVPAALLATFFLALGMPGKGWFIFNVPGAMAVTSYFVASRLTH